MSVQHDDFLLLRRLAPEDHGLTVFDADTQETSYGTLVVDKLPLIFDTHRKETWYVSTAEMLTEIQAPASVSQEEVNRFTKIAEHVGMQAIPYSACFFKGSLHVYAYYGPVRGFDVSAVAETVADAERKLTTRIQEFWQDVPLGVRQAQKELLAGTRKARYPADLEVLIQRMASTTG